MDGVKSSRRQLTTWHQHWKHCCVLCGDRLVFSGHSPDVVVCCWPQQQQQNRTVAAATTPTVPCRRQRQISSAVNNYLPDEPWAPHACSQHSSRSVAAVGSVTRSVQTRTTLCIYRWPTPRTSLSTCCTSSNAPQLLPGITRPPPPSLTTRRQPAPPPHRPPTKTRTPSSCSSARYHATSTKTICVRCSRSSGRFTSWWCSKTASPAYTRVYAPCCTYLIVYLSLARYYSNGCCQAEAVYINFLRYSAPFQVLQYILAVIGNSLYYICLLVISRCSSVSAASEPTIRDVNLYTISAQVRL